MNENKKPRFRSSTHLVLFFCCPPYSLLSLSHTLTRHHTRVHTHTHTHARSHILSFPLSLSFLLDLLLVIRLRYNYFIEYSTWHRNMTSQSLASQRNKDYKLCLVHLHRFDLSLLFSRPLTQAST